MKELYPSPDPVETMGEAYELLLKKTLHTAHQSDAVVHTMAESIRDDAIALIKFGDDEIVKLEGYLKRDLIDAARYLDHTGKELQDWLGFDLALIKQEFWGRFSAAADQTTVELDQLKLQAEVVGYRTGEITGLGRLVCDQCGEKLHFHKPGHIPPCPKCNTTHFHRYGYPTQPASL